MSEEKLTYKELVRILIDRINSQDKKFDNLDKREIIIQKALARLEGKLEGRKEGSKIRRWQIATVISVIGLVVSIIVAVVK